MPTNQWNTYANLYDQGVGTGGDALHAKLIDPVVLELLGNLRGKEVLELGCGNGYFLNTLSEKAKSVIGVDGSGRLIEKAKNHTPCEVIHADLSKKLPFPAAKFDLAVSIMVIQYLSKLEAFVKESARVLKQGGLLVVALDHPGHALFMRAQELLGKKNEKFLTSGSYFQTGKRTKKSLWDKAILEYYHRSLMEYVNAFTPYYKLEQIVENSEDEEMPRILVMKWRKL